MQNTQFAMRAAANTVTYTQKTPTKADNSLIASSIDFEFPTHSRIIGGGGVPQEMKKNHNEKKCVIMTSSCCYVQ